MFFFFFWVSFLFDILYKGKHLGIQQSLTWQTEEQRNIRGTGNEKNAGKRAGSGIHYTLNQSLPTWIQAHQHWNEEQGHIQSENTQKLFSCFPPQKNKIVKS